MNELLNFYGMYLKLEDVHNVINHKMKQTFQRLKKEYNQDTSKSFQMGINRFEGIMSGLQPREEDFKNIIEKLNETWDSIWNIGAFQCIDDGVLSHKVNHESKQYYNKIEDPVPVGYWGKGKPHPNGFITHQLSSRSVKTGLPFVVKLRVWTDYKKRLKEHETLQYFLNTWNKPYPPHFFADGKFCTTDFFHWRNDITYYGTFSANKHWHPWVWRLLKFNLGPNKWRAFEKSGNFLISTYIISNASKIDSYSLVTNAFSGSGHLNIEDLQGETGYVKEELELLSVSRLKQLLRKEGLKLTGKKEEQIHRLFIHRPRQPKKVCLELIKSIKEILFTNDPIHHDFYGKYHNATDRADFYWNMAEYGFHLGHWRTRLCFGILKFGIINSWTAYCEKFDKVDFQYFREKVAEGLMDMQYQYKKAGRPKASY